MRLFIGELKRDGRSCFGLRTSQVVGMSCGVDLAGGTPLQVGETTFRGYKMVSGLVSPKVEAVFVTNVRGRNIRIPVRNGTFFFGGGAGEAVEAYDGAGQLVGRYELER